MHRVTKPRSVLMRGIDILPDWSSSVLIGQEGHLGICSAFHCVSSCSSKRDALWHQYSGTRPLLTWHFMSTASP